MSEAIALQPRYVRATKAPGYCGMCRALFDQEILPYLIEIPLGKQGIAYDRLDLDAALDDYKARVGRAPRKLQGANKCKKGKVVPAFSSGAASGSSTKGSTVADLAKALARQTGKKRSGI